MTSEGRVDILIKLSRAGVLKSPGQAALRTLKTIQRDERNKAFCKMRREPEGRSVEQDETVRIL